MHRIASSLIAASLIMNAGLALAWSDVTGKIDRIDARSHEIVLDNGKHYYLQKDVSMKNIKPGDRVKLSFEEQKGRFVVNKMTKA